jgi:histone H3/H4
MAMAKAKCSGKEMMIVASKVRELIKSKGGLTSGELLPALNDKVHYLVGKAVERAKANKRSTVKAQDL